MIADNKFSDPEHIIARTADILRVEFSNAIVYFFIVVMDTGTSWA